MIRGSIEQVTEQSVSGWLYADTASVRDRLVLAFVEDQCVGAGRVEHFRQDLADAGLADGVLGFHFPIVLPGAADGAQVTVRLEGSDAVLLQDRSRVVGARAPAVEGGVPRSLSSLQWMRMRGWLEQSEYDFLRYLDQLGVYERSLVVPKRAGEPAAEPALLDPAAVAQDLLRLHYLDEVGLGRRTIGSLAELSGTARDSAGPNGFEPVVALWSRERARIVVVEASHRRQATDGNGSAHEAGTGYGVGPDRLLFLNPRCTFAPRGAAPAEGFLIFGIPGEP